MSSWSMALLTYATVWCITLLWVLPLGLTYPDPAHREHMHYAGAPLRPHLKKKIALNTLIAAVVTLGIHLLLLSGIIPLRRVIL